MNKWIAEDMVCPFSMSSARGDGAKRCISESCMLWVWDRVIPNDPRPTTNNILPYPPLPTTQSNTNGHCGLLK